MKRSSYKDNMDGKTQIAGYAMALEKEYHVPISVGCLVFSSTLTDNGNEPKREIFGLDDKLRADFISRRDNAIKIALGQYLPAFPPNADWKCKNCEAREPCYSIPPNGMPNG
jgi:CRISPR/Cas system-associated exonuclease Cas4 (RecB family)